MTQVDLPDSDEATSSGAAVSAPARLVLAVATVVVTLAALTVAAVALVQRGEILPGTQVAGVDVGGLSPADAAARLAPVVARRTNEDLTLTVDDATFPLTPADVGYQVDVEATVTAAYDAGRRGPVWDSVWARLSAPWSHRSVPVIDRVDMGQLQAYVAGVAGRVDGLPDAGAVGIDPRTAAVSVRLPAVGRAVEQPETVQRLREALVGSRDRTVEIPVRRTRPPTRPEAIQAGADLARRALDAPLRLSGAGKTLEIPPTVLAPALLPEFVDVDGGKEVRLSVSQQALLDALGDALDAVETKAQSARVTVERGQATLDAKGDASFAPVPAAATVTRGATPGREVDREALTRTVTAMVNEGRSTGELPVAVTQPKVTEAAAQKVNALLGTFTTYHACCQVRVSNIHTMADAVDQTIVAPGASFSINDFIGPRTRAKGYGGAPTIIAGELEDTVGGGVSQFATTMFNAVFFAGLRVDDHKPHSFYISRYPPGREATVNYPGVDLRWTNTTDAPVVIRTSYTDRSITVSIYGAGNGQSVRGITGPRQAYPGGNFKISVTRVITRADGSESRDTYFAAYNNPPAGE